MAATAKAVFEADLGKLDTALLKVQGSMLRLQKGVAGVFLAFKGLQAAGQMVGSQFESVKKAFDLGGELSDMSVSWRTSLLGDTALHGSPTFHQGGLRHRLKV